jgi:poly-gamma-glutamate synthesis protein (capsule biosynthesis protein)
MLRSSLWFALIILAVAPVARSAQQPAARRDTAGLRLGVPNGFSLAAVGDLIQTHPVSPARTPGFAEVIARIAGATVAFGNFESNAIDMKTFHGYPEAENGGLWLRSDPEVVADQKAMGFDLVALANNNSYDWGPEGMRETDRWLDQAGIVHAGTGETRSAARAPHYLATPQGTVALVSMTSSFTPLSRSMNAVNEAPGRPGVNAVRIYDRVLVSPAMLRALRPIHAAQPKGSFQPADANSTDLELFGVRYRSSPAIRDQVAISYEVDSTDVGENLAAIRTGKANADFLVATIHSHEPDNWSEAPADFVPGLAHAAIDAGADAFIGHGPHRLRGIEIYRGRPIFYSLGNFFFQVSGIKPIAMDLYEQFDKDPRTMTDAEFLGWFEHTFFGGEDGPVWYRSVVAVSTYQDGALSEIRLYPVELGFNEGDASRGVPRPASSVVAQQILATLARLSRPFGTTIAVEGNVGVIRVARRAATR